MDYGVNEQIDIAIAYACRRGDMQFGRAIVPFAHLYFLFAQLQTMLFFSLFLSRCYLLSLLLIASIYLTRFTTPPNKWARKAIKTLLLIALHKVRETLEIGSSLGRSVILSARYHCECELCMNTARIAFYVGGGEWYNAELAVHRFFFFRSIFFNMQFNGGM